MTHETLAAALAAFQAELPTVAKGNEAKVATKTGGEYKYQYADLTDVTAAAMPVLTKHGLSFTSKPTMTENGFVLAYRLLHESGEEDAGEYPLPDPAHTQAQQMGSAITYARRYCLCAATGIAPGGDDDDAQQAQSAPPRGRAQPRRQPANDHINTALAGIAKCTDPQTLDQIEQWAISVGIAGVAAVRKALDSKRAEVGTPDRSAAWTPAGEEAAPVSSSAGSEMSEEEFEAAEAARFDAEAGAA